MDFSLNSDQEALKSSVQDFLSKEARSPAIRRISESEHGFDEQVWSKVAGMGWPALIVPEDLGGLGLGWVEVAIIAEQLGASLLPVPFYSTLGAITALMLAGSEQQKKEYLPALAEGSKIGTVALWEGHDQTESGVRLEAVTTEDGLILNGKKLFVTDAGIADVFLITARVDGGPVELVLVDADTPGVSVSDLDAVDRTRRQSVLDLNHVRVPSERTLPDGDSLSILRDRLELVLAAEQAGIAARCLELSVEFASTRQQFGKPIGSYQGVSHKLADMYLAAQHSSSLVLYAAWAADVDDHLAATAIWRAFWWGTQAAEKATADAIQVHGGIGFTWEHDLHMFFKRARANSVLLDSPASALDRISSAG